MEPYKTPGFAYYLNQLDGPSRVIFRKKCENETDLHCHMCFDIVENPVAPKCMHPYCMACFELIATKMTDCPSCRSPMVIEGGKAQSAVCFYLNNRMEKIWKKVKVQSNQSHSLRPSIKPIEEIGIKSQKKVIHSSHSSSSITQPFNHNMDDGLFAFVIQTIATNDSQNFEAIPDILLHNPQYVQQYNEKGETLLLIACQIGNLKLVETLITYDADCNQKNPLTGEFPLLIAAKAKHMDVVDFLIGKDADVTQEDNKGNTLLTISTYEEQTKIINSSNMLNKATNQKGAFEDNKLSISKQNNIRNSPLDNNCDVNDLFNTILQSITNELDHNLDVLRQAFQSNPQAVNKPNKNGETLLHIACKQGNIQFVEALSMCQADLNQKNAKTGAFALKLTSLGGHFDVMKFLLDKGADINLQDNDGNTTLLMASDNKDFLTISMLIKYEKLLIDKQNHIGNTPLSVAKKKGYSVIERILIENGANIIVKNNTGHLIAPSETLKVIPTTDVDYQTASTVNNTLQIRPIDNDIDKWDNEGNTPLTKACLDNDREAISSLIAKGANIDCINSKGESPLYICVIYKRLGLIELLLEKGANVNSKDNLGNTVLHTAIRMYNLSLKKGANVNLKDSLEKRILHTPIGMDEFGIISLLLQSKDINVNLPNNEGVLPLGFANEGPNLTLSQLLIKVGAVLRVLPQNDETDSIVNSVINQNLKMVDQFLKEGANVNIKDNQGEPLLHIAVRKRNISLVELLLKSKDISINIPNDKGETALVLANEGNNLPLVELLVKHGATLIPQSRANTVKNKAEPVVSPVNNVEKITPIKTISGQLDNDRNENLIKSCLQNDADSLSNVSISLALGANINYINSKGEFPLNISVKNQDLAMIDYLLVEGADVNLQDPLKEETALHTAVRMKNFKIVEMLVKRKNINVNLKNHQGYTPLSFAYMHDNYELIEFLVNNNAIQ